MIELNIPGRGMVQLKYLVCDVSGTLTVDGRLPEGVKVGLNALRDRLGLNLITADTYGKQDLIDQQLNLQAIRLHPGMEKEQKEQYVRHLGADAVVAIGQGSNDAGMLQAAALGICVLSPEGTAVETLLVADIVVTSIDEALELLEKPLRIVATLRQ